MSDKVSYKNILEDFKARHPNLAKLVCYWCPRGYATITIHLKDGIMLSYDYDDKRAVILAKDWTEH